MPNPDPSPATRFTKGRPKTGGRQRGTPNKPITVKLAMKTFTSERGAEMIAFADEVMNLPNWVEVGEKGHICLLPYKMQVWVEINRYGIGKHANQAQDTGRGSMNVYPKYPIGTDPDAMDRLIEDEIARRGYVPGPGSRQQQGVRPARDRAAILNKAVLKAVKHPEVTLRTEDGVELEIVDEQLPEQHDPDRQGESE